MSRPAGLFVLLAAAACASAQVTLSTVQGGVATPVPLVGGAHWFGSVAAYWDVSDVVFNISDTNTEPFLWSFSLQGTSFTVIKTDWQPQSLPAPIPAAGLNFTVRFQPGQVAESLPAATLKFEVTDAANKNGVFGTVVLSGGGVPGFTVTTGNQPLPYGHPLPFGSDRVGPFQTLPLTLPPPRTH